MLASAATPHAPVPSPRVTRYRFARVPKAGRSQGGSLTAKDLLFDFLINEIPEGEAKCVPTPYAMGKLRIPRSSLNRAFSALASKNAPGCDHPYIRITGATNKRTIEVLYRPFGRSSDGDQTAALVIVVRSQLLPEACAVCVASPRMTKGTPNAPF